MAKFTAAEVDNDVVQPCEEKEYKVEPGEWHWIEIELVYEETSEPVPGEEYLIKLPDGGEVRGFLNQEGRARVDFITDPGSCQVSFPNLDSELWEAG